MLPLGLPFCQRRSSSSVRTVFSTTPGISSYQALDALVPGIVTRTINDFDCIHARGQNAKEFSDMCAFFGDYPTSSLVIDVRMHMAGASCTHSHCYIDIAKSD